MDLFLFNLGWMIFNVLLALIPVLLAKLVFEKKLNLLKLLGAVAWFFFLPNTTYLLTDIINLLYDVKFLNGFFLFWNTVLYLVLIPIGIVTYILAVRPFEKMFPGKINLIILNLLVGFGIVLGRVQRANSWEVVTDPFSVLYKSIEILKSWDLLILTLLFAFISYVFYEALKKVLPNT